MDKCLAIKKNNVKELSWLFDKQCKACHDFVQASFAEYEKRKPQGDDAINQHSFDIVGYNKDDFDLITDPQYVKFFKQCAQEVDLDRVPPVYVEKADSQYVTKLPAYAAASVGVIVLARDVFHSLQQNVKADYPYGVVRKTLLHEMGHIKHRHVLVSAGMSDCTYQAVCDLKNDFNSMELMWRRGSLWKSDDAQVKLYELLQKFRKRVMENPFIKFGKSQELAENLIFKYKHAIDQGLKSQKFVSHRVVSQEDIDSLVQRSKEVWDLAGMLHDERQADFEAYTHLNCYKCAEENVFFWLHFGKSRISRDMKGYWPADFIKMAAAGLKQRGMLCSYHQSKH